MESNQWDFHDHDVDEENLLASVVLLRRQLRKTEQSLQNVEELFRYVYVLKAELCLCTNVSFVIILIMSVIRIFVKLSSIGFLCLKFSFFSSSTCEHNDLNESVCDNEREILTMEDLGHSSELRNSPAYSTVARMSWKNRDCTRRPRSNVIIKTPCSNFY